MNDVPSQPPAEAAPRASRYEVLAKIASGGMATVFVGRTRGAIGFSRLVAIKRPHGFVSRDPGMQRGLELEARVASKIHHPHVVSILDVELVGDELSLILDYVEGGTVQDLSAHGKRSGVPLGTGVAVRIVLDTASGLHAAHALRDGTGAPVGIIHRDVSPQNILVGVDGQSRLTDFGIAKIANQLEIEQTATGVLKGKLGYLPPEYVVSREFDAQSDQYALAVVAWETLTGSRMFGGYNDGEVMRQIACGAAPTLSSARPDLEPLDAIFARALARNPGERYESVAAFAEALEARAREHGWVAPHGEVGALVEAAVGDKVRQRRSAIESSSPPSSLSMKADPQAKDAGAPSPRRLELPRPRTPMPRDAMATRSLPAEVLPLPATARTIDAALPSPSTPLADTRQVPMTTLDALPTLSIPSASLGEEAEAEAEAERRAPTVPPPAPSVRRWWPVAPVVVIAALTGFGITRGILAPRPAAAPASQSASAVAVMVETAPSDVALVPTPTPPRPPEDPSLTVPPGFVGALPPQPPPPAVAPLPPVPAPSHPEIHAQPQPVRPQPRSRRPTPAGPAAADARGASSAAIPVRAPPNPYAL